MYGIYRVGRSIFDNIVYIGNAKYGPPNIHYACYQ